MERARLLRDLSQTNRHIARGEDHIARQQRIVTGLTTQGLADYAHEARKLLAGFQDLQNWHLQHRDKLLAELEG